MRLFPAPAEPPGRWTIFCRLLVLPAVAEVLLYIRTARPAEVAMFPMFQPCRVAAAVVMLTREFELLALNVKTLYCLVVLARVPTTPDEALITVGLLERVTVPEVIAVMSVPLV